MILSPTQLERFGALLGPGGVLTAPEEIAPFCADWRGRERGHAPCVLLPASTSACAALVGFCAEQHLPLCPQGGGTGLVLGAVPNGEILLSLKRLNRIRHVDPINDALIVEAGVPLAAVQECAKAHDRLFPLSLASEGSALIGGLCATNAGGVGVLQYGMMRDLVLGLEVVLPDGRVWDGLTALRKDNSGLDLKHLFLGAEGILGVITAASLELFPLPKGYSTALAATSDLAKAVALLTFAKARTRGRVTAFEAMPALGIKLVCDQFPGTRSPLALAHPWHVLIEISHASPANTGEDLEGLLADAAREGLLLDGVIANSEAQRQDFWALRERLPLSEKAFGAALKHDISVPISAIAEFYDAALARVAQIAPMAQVIAFGHLGDGNLHFNVAMAQGGPLGALAPLEGEVTGAILDLVAFHRGSFSAEHGIGRQKLTDMQARKSPVALDLMRAIKQALDPLGLMNPGRVISPAPLNQEGQSP